jgi:hypothetical protein
MAEPGSLDAAPAIAPGRRPSDIPTAGPIIPYDRAPLAAPGERIIFNANFTDTLLGASAYQLEYTTTGGHFTSATGPTSRTVAGLVSGNVDFFIPSPWLGTPAVQVVMVVRRIADSVVVRTETWNFGLKINYPTTMSQREGTGERTMPAIYTYDIGPPLYVALPPHYQHQTILERFSNWTLANIAPADIEAGYRTTHGLTSAAAVSSHFLTTYRGSNGTFTVSAADTIRDRHDYGTDLTNLTAHLAAAKDIEVALPQTYEARPGTTLGSYTVTRVLKTDGTWRVRKG